MSSTDTERFKLSTTDKEALNCMISTWGYKMDEGRNLFYNFEYYIHHLQNINQKWSFIKQN